MKQGWKQMNKNISIDAKLLEKLVDDSHCLLNCARMNHWSGAIVDDLSDSITKVEAIIEQNNEKNSLELSLDEARKIVKILETYRHYFHLTEENFYIGPLKKIFNHHKQGN